MTREYEFQNAEQLLAADVIALEYALLESKRESDMLRLMLSESLEISHQAIARLWQKTLDERRA